MRKPKALVIPFKFREGYPDAIVDPLIEDAVQLIAKTGIENQTTKAVVTDQDADEVNGKYVPDQYDFLVLLVPTWF